MKCKLDFGGRCGYSVTCTVTVVKGLAPQGSLGGLKCKSSKYKMCVAIKLVMNTYASLGLAAANFGILILYHNDSLWYICV